MINLTPHAINILDNKTGKTLVIPPSGTVARVAQTYTEQGYIPIEGLPVPVVSAQYGKVSGLPDDANTPILVSAMVLAALKYRPNTYAPDTNVGAIRDEKGHIQAVTRLIVA